MRYTWYRLLQNYVHGDYRRQKEILIRELESHVLNLPVGSQLSVLELACGGGNLASIFSPDIYLGIDILEERIAMARKDHPGYKFEVADINSLQFAERLVKFNFIFCHGFLHHLDDQRCRDLLRHIQFSANKPTTFVAIEGVLPDFLTNPLGFVLAKMDEGAYIRSPQKYRMLFGDNPCRTEWLNFFPRWPVNEEVYVLSFSNKS